MTKRLTPVVALALALTVAGSLVAFSLLAQDFVPRIGAGQNLFPQGVQAGMGEAITLASPTPIDTIIGARVDAAVPLTSSIDAGTIPTGVQNDLDAKRSVTVPERVGGTSIPKLDRTDASKPKDSGRKGSADKNARPSKKSSHGKPGGSRKASTRSSTGTSAKGSRRQATDSGSSTAGKKAKASASGSKSSRGRKSSGGHSGSRGRKASGGHSRSRGH
ncbi:MAG: hypothetical protein M3345_06880 [Actinomycetota bacterium]|nr:hypothetical protein [Actinomycetota bacterium]